MEKPKNLQEIAKLFEDKFGYLEDIAIPIGGMSYGYNSVDCKEEIEQFWLEHIKTLLESVRMEDRPIKKLTTYEQTWYHTQGYNQRNQEINQKIQFLLSEGEEGEV